MLEQQIQSQEADLVATIDAATAELRAVGAAAEAALAEYQRQKCDTMKRLAAVAFAFQHRAAPAPEPTPAPVELPESAVVGDAPEQPTESPEQAELRRLTILGEEQAAYNRAEAAAVSDELAAWSSGRFDEIEGPPAAAVAVPKEVQPVAGATTAANGKKRRR